MAPPGQETPPCWADHGGTDGSWALGPSGDAGAVNGSQGCGCRQGRCAQVPMWHGTHLASRVLR